MFFLFHRRLRGIPSRRFKASLGRKGDTMSLNLNPQGINGPAWAGNYVQPDYRVPSAVVTSPTGANSLNLSWPIPAYSQPGTSAPPTPVAGQLTGGPLGVSNNP
jgi:hypothetical protein